MLAGIVLSVVLCCQNKKSRPTTTYFGKPQKTKKTKNSIETRRQIIVNILANRGGILGCCNIQDGGLSGNS